jgi:hypothetical protein
VRSRASSIWYRKLNFGPVSVGRANRIRKGQIALAVGLKEPGIVLLDPYERLIGKLEIVIRSEALDGRHRVVGKGLVADAETSVAFGFASVTGNRYFHIDALRRVLPS